MYLRLFLASALFAGGLAAQSSTGTATMTGAVMDTTGAVIPQAKVTVTNKDAGFVFTSITTSEGTWYIPNLNSGDYQLKIEAQGFKTYVQDGIILRTAEQPRIDVRLEVGSVAESVMVTAAPPLLETETATSGQVLEGQTIVKMPVLQKAFYRIYLYMPGITAVREMNFEFAPTTELATVRVVFQIFRFELFFSGLPLPEGESGRKRSSTMRGEPWPDRFLPAHGPSAALRIPEVCDSLSRRLSAEEFLLLGSVSGDGVCPVHLP